MKILKKFGEKKEKKLKKSTLSNEKALVVYKC
jgi:hypothetical protein